MHLHVSALGVGHLQEVRKFFEVCSLLVSLYGTNYTDMIEIVVMKLNITILKSLCG
jgi:hypothetical protein